MLKIIAEGPNGQYSLVQLLKIMEALRGPDGCPWDKEQTHQSIRNDALEEVYEVVDAIDNNDAAALCEELGDMLLQVVFHSCIAAEDGEFTFADVVDTVSKKLVLRHPHVFGEEQVNDSGEVLNLWDNIKKQEKNQTSYSDTLKSVPKAFPALLRAAKVQKRAKKAGVEICNPISSGRLEELIARLKSVQADGDEKAIGQVYGELLFETASLEHILKINAEQALASATDEFISRFEADEKDGTLKEF